MEKNEVEVLEEMRELYRGAQKGAGRKIQDIITAIGYLKRKERRELGNYRHVKCKCGSVWRYRGKIMEKGRCPRCGEMLWEGETVSKEVLERLKKRGVVGK